MPSGAHHLSKSTARDTARRKNVGFNNLQCTCRLNACAKFSILNSAFGDDGGVYSCRNKARNARFLVGLEI